MKVKLKNLLYEDAKKICEKHLRKNDYAENSCDNCPLKLSVLSDFCGKSFAFINNAVGDKEIVLERNDKDD